MEPQIPHDEDHCIEAPLKGKGEVLPTKTEYAEYKYIPPLIALAMCIQYLLLKVLQMVDFFYENQAHCIPEEHLILGDTEEDLYPMDLTKKTKHPMNYYECFKELLYDRIN